MILSPDFGFGGAERSAAALSRLLNKYVEVHFIVFNKKIQQSHQVYGIIHSLEVSEGKNFFHKGFQFFKRVNRLKRLKKKLDINVTISFLEGADYVNVFSRVNDKIILSIRGSKKFDPNIKGLIGLIRLNFLIPYFYNQADVIVVVSNGIREELINSFKLSKDKPVHVIPNFYFLEDLKMKSQEQIPDSWFDFFSREKTIVTVGRIAYEKGLDRFVPVFKRILCSEPNLKWIIIGDGPYMNIIKGLLLKEGITLSGGVEVTDFSANVFFLGQQSNPYKWLKRSTAFVLCSLTEGFPNALVEAMALGVPVVSTDCKYGPSEILSGQKDESGYLRTYGILLPLLVNEEKVTQAWCNCITLLINQKELQMHYSRQSFIRSQEFSYKTIGDLWLKLLL